MTDKEFIDCKLHRNILLFKIISRCNDSCDFCIEYDNIKNNKNDLSFVEIKKNYEFFKDRFDIDYIVLSGGEPTLHQDFFKIINYFKTQGIAFRIITNILKFYDNDFLLKFKNFFSGFENRGQEKLSSLILSINDLPECGFNALRRIEGLKKVMSAHLPLMMTVVVYKHNLESLPRIAGMLRKFFIENKFYKNLYIELRLAYIKDIEHDLFKNYAPNNFLQVKKSIEIALSVLNVPGINLILWNFPFCYLNKSSLDKKIDAGQRLKRRFIKITKDFQLGCAKVRNWESFLKDHTKCNFCEFKEKCGGIEQDYIEKFSFPRIER